MSSTYETLDRSAASCALTVIPSCVLVEQLGTTGNRSTDKQYTLGPDPIVEWVLDQGGRDCRGCNRRIGLPGSFWSTLEIAPDGSHMRSNAHNDSKCMSWMSDKLKSARSTQASPQSSGASSSGRSAKGDLTSRGKAKGKDKRR